MAQWFEGRIWGVEIVRSGYGVVGELEVADAVEGRWYARFRWLCCRDSQQTSTKGRVSIVEFRKIVT